MQDIQEKATPFLVACGNFFFRYRNAVFPLVMLALFATFPPGWSGASERLNLGLNLAGLALALSGQVLRAAVIGFAYIKRGGLNKQVYATTLVTDGFFGICRNPLYVGNLLMQVGLLVIHGNPWVLVLGMAFFVFAYMSIVAAEECFLSGKFGEDYSAYCCAVNRWWPDFGRLARSTEGMRFVWRRVVIKDYSTLCSNLVTALLLLAYEAVYQHGLPAAQSQLTVYGVLLVLLGTAALAVRYAKKSGQLTEHVS
jgi:protein-S-isoprenylcysteine O-methyltransferase Ste14